MKKIASITLALFFLFSTLLFSACSSVNVAVGFVSVSKNNFSSISFFTLKGSHVFQCVNSEYQSANLSLTAEVEEGSFNLYYSLGNEKICLATVTPDEPLNLVYKDVMVGKNRTVKIYVETVTTAQNGKVVVELVNKKA